MPKLRWITLLFLLALSAACSRNVYEVEMKAQGEVLDRQLVFWRESHLTRQYSLKTPHKAELERIATAYHQKLPNAEPKKFKLKAQFKEDTPNDIGGVGYWRHYDTSLGSVSYYMERFRGNDDMAGSIAKQQKAVDELVDLIKGWLRSKLGDKPGWSQLDQFIKQELREDAKNLILYLWSADKESIARAVLYLAEHKYFPPQQWPQLSRLMEDKPLETGKEALQGVLRVVLARKLQLNKESPLITELINLLFAKELEKSILAYIRTTDEWKQREAQWKKTRQEQAPEPEDVLEEIGDDLALGLSFILGDELRVVFLASRQPLESNGAWDAKQQRLTWNMTLSTNKLPRLAYATWIEAAGEFQQARFGKIALKDWELLQYIMWYERLTAAQKKEWDAFLQRLGGDKNTVERLKKFRFSKESDVERVRYSLFVSCSWSHWTADIIYVCSQRADRSCRHND